MFLNAIIIASLRDFKLNSRTKWISSDEAVSYIPNFTQYVFSMLKS